MTNYYSCAYCGDAIEGDDIDVRHTDDDTGEDLHQGCCERFGRCEHNADDYYHAELALAARIDRARG